MKAYVFGGGTVSHVRPHLALAAPAYGGTARSIADLLRGYGEVNEVVEVLTRMANHASPIETNLDVEKEVAKVIEDKEARILFFSTAMCDFEGQVSSNRGAEPSDIPDTARKALLTLLYAHDFLGYQLSAQKGGMSEAVLDRLADKYLRRVEWKPEELTRAVQALAQLIPERLDADTITTVLACSLDEAIGALKASATVASGDTFPASGKDQKRLRSDKSYTINITPAAKIIGKIRETRKDIFLVGFKTTAGASEDEQFAAGLRLCKEAHCNLVLANDVHTRVGMIVTPEQSRYSVTKDRALLLEELVDMTIERAKGTFARCDVRPGDLIPLESEEIPDSLRTVLQYAVKAGAYKPFNDKCVGHFAVRKPDDSVLCSIRRSNYNKDIKFVRMITVNERETIAFGARPSAGSRSQWIMFNRNPKLNCVIHFHCPLLPGAAVTTRPQKYFECGSNECGRNTAEGLTSVSEDGLIHAVMLDNHGPNILFNSEVDPKRVIDFIEKNFDLSKTTQGNSSE